MVDIILTDFNNLRKKPVSLQKKFKTVAKAFLRIKKTKEANELDAFADTLTNMDPMATFTLSEGLCKAAAEELQHMKRDGGHHQKKNYEDLNNHVGKYCYDFTELYELTDHGGLDMMVPRCMISDHDPDREYRQAIFNRVYKFIGIATAEFEDEDATCIIFADNIREKTPKKAINLKDYTELKKAYDYFDINKNELVDVKELKSGLRSLNYDTRNPTVYQIICTLDIPENKRGVDFETFAIAFDDALNDTNSSDGLYKLFNVFVNEPTSDKISANTIRKLVRDIGEKLSMEEIKEIMNRAALDGNEINFDEFYDIMIGYYGDKAEEIIESKPVKTTTTTTKKK